MITDIIAILCLFLLNGLLSMAEIAIVTARRARLQNLAEDGKKGAAVAIELNREPGKFLSTVQSGITLIGILTGAIGGAAIIEPLATHLEHRGWFGAYGHDAAFVIVVVIESYISVVIGELVPKQVALRYAEPIAIAAAPFMHGIARYGAPLIFVLDISSRGIMRLFGVKAYDAQAVTEDEVKTMVAEGAETGVFHPAEREMVTRVLRFADRTARSIMTPRMDILWLQVGEDIASVEAKILAYGHSRFPLGSEGAAGLDDVKGIVHVRDILLQRARGEELNLLAICHPAPVVHEDTPVLEVLEVLREHATRQAVVVDEYGITEGLVTMTDILEAVVGALPDLHGDGDAPVEEVSAGSWIMEGSLPIDDAKLTLNLRTLPGEEEVSTLAGFILTALGRVPKVNDEAVYGGYRFSVMAMDGRRVDKVSVTAIPPEPDEE
jgi:putative hemolysin